MSWAERSSVLSLGVGGWGDGWVKVEIKAISAQPTEVGVGLSWAELGNKLLVIIRIIVIRSESATSKSVIMMFGNDFEYLEYALEKCFPCDIL